MFLIGVWHLDFDLDIIRNLAYTFPEVLITLSSVKAHLACLDLAQICCAKVGGGSLKLGISSSLGLSRSILQMITN